MRNPAHLHIKRTGFLQVQVSGQERETEKESQNPPVVEFERNVFSLNIKRYVGVRTFFRRTENGVHDSTRALEVSGEHSVGHQSVAGGNSTG